MDKQKPTDLAKVLGFKEITISVKCRVVKGILNHSRKILYNYIKKEVIDIDYLKEELKYIEICEHIYNNPKYKRNILDSITIGLYYKLMGNTGKYEEYKGEVLSTKRAVNILSNCNFNMRKAATELYKNLICYVDNSNYSVFKSKGYNATLWINFLDLDEISR